MKHIIIDTREKPKAIAGIKKYFDAHNIEYEIKKLDFGDYMTDEHGAISIDRKQNILELSRNCAAEHARFKRELERARNAGAKLVILVEQNRYIVNGEHIRVKEPIDLLRWSSRYTVINGDHIYRTLYRWLLDYDLQIVFCAKQSTGYMIDKILYGDENA